MRRDIQFLRGIAVLLVVIYHAGSNLLAHGYLGVDVFFVLSGFLITKIILQGLDSGNFSFRAFYLRRAKRLLPALYSTLLVTALIASAMLTPNLMADFVEQFIGAVTFLANIVLPTQISYFADEAETKPLLHIWSLSLEEQYYFLLPLFLFTLDKKWRLAGMIALTAISLAWCLSWVTSTGEPPLLWRFGDAQVNEWAFFLFPTRAWELLAGSICAWIMLRYAGFRIPPTVKWLSLVTVLAVSVWGVDQVHPRGNALAVVVATAILVLGDDRWLPGWTPFRFIERIGDWSYSVYLVHWPLFVFAYLGFVNQMPAWAPVPLVLASIAVGYLQYRYVETPFRYHWDHPSGYVWRRIAIASVMLLGAPLAVIGQTAIGTAGPDAISEIRQINYGLSHDCKSSFQDSVLKPGCVSGDAPRIAVWGDSYAMHLVPGLVKANPKLAQLTKSVCGPISGLGPVLKKYNRDWAQSCNQHNAESLAYILRTDSISHVVLSSSFVQYFGPREGQFLRGEYLEEKDPLVARDHFVRTIEILKNAGKQPVLISPPPSSGFDVGACLEREARRLISFRLDCDIDRDEYQQKNRAINENLTQVAEHTGIQIIWLDDLLCEASRCRSKLGDTFVYRDAGHLSLQGSVALLERLIIGAAD